MEIPTQLFENRFGFCSQPGSWLFETTSTIDANNAGDPEIMSTIMQALTPLGSEPRKSLVAFIKVASGWDRGTQIVLPESRLAGPRRLGAIRPFLVLRL